MVRLWSFGNSVVIKTIPYMETPSNQPIFQLRRQLTPFENNKGNGREETNKDADKTRRVLLHHTRARRADVGRDETSRQPNVSSQH